MDTVSHLKHATSPLLKLRDGLLCSGVEIDRKPDVDHRRTLKI
jgi:hypothetical protein